MIIKILSILIFHNNVLQAGFFSDISMLMIIIHLD